MKMNLTTSGLDGAVNMLGGMVKEGRSARRQALKDLGRFVAKELRAARRAGAGWPALGAVSKAMGNKRPWGKSKFSVYAPKSMEAVIVTTKGKNKKMEEGGYVTVPDSFKKYLHTQGIHMRATTNMVRIPARPLFRPTWNKVQPLLIRQYEVRFHYRLTRAMRRWRVE